MVTPVTAPLAPTVISTVAPDPDPDAEVAIADPAEYPVPAALIEPRVLAPLALALVIVITSDAA